MTRILAIILAVVPVFTLFAGESPAHGFTDAAEFGFSPQATGTKNTEALQAAVDHGGTITVSGPGTYAISGTVYIGSNTSLVFGNGVVLKKVAEGEPFSHVLVNKGARTKTYDSHISVEGLQIIVNGVDVRTFKDAYGLHGQLAFFYAKDVRIEHFRCLDLGKAQYGIQVCTFEDLTVDDAIIKGLKDGVHLGRGKRFRISNCLFETFDDAIALNGHDYATGNPELGWIEDGVVENCHDLDAQKTTGYFCRILAGGWMDWKPGMEVQQSDTVVSDGKLYRVQEQPDGRVFKSLARPTHAAGQAVLDGIHWGLVQTDVTYTAGVRNVIFRNIFLHKARTAFSIHFDNDKYSRSYYPGAQIPVQQNITLENVQCLQTRPITFLSIATPVDAVNVLNSRLANDQIRFVTNGAMKEYGTTYINMNCCTFSASAPTTLLVNSVPGKNIVFNTSGSIQLSDKWSAAVEAGGGQITIDSDLSGLRR